MKRLSRGALAITCAGLLGGCTNVVFSPDGRHVAFIWPHERDTLVATMAVDGQGFRFLPGSKDREPLAWSPDGTRLLLKGANDPGDLFLFNWGTGASRKVLDRHTGPALWTDDPNRIILGQHMPDSAKDSLLWLDLATGQPTVRVDLTGLDFQDPPEACYLKSFDGIAFLGMDANVYAAYRGELHRITSTGDVVGLTANSAGDSLTWARKSRNVNYILTSLYRYDLNRRTVARLPFPERVSAINPSPRSNLKELVLARFSPNGEEMALLVETNSNDKKEPGYRVYRIGLDGGKAAPISTAAVPWYQVAALNWSPDGRSIAMLEAREEAVRLVLHTPGQRKVLKSVSGLDKKP